VGKWGQPRTIFQYPVFRTLDEGSGELDPAAKLALVFRKSMTTENEDLTHV
jgi:hypothetical protein